LLPVVWLVTDCFELLLFISEDVEMVVFPLVMVFPEEPEPLFVPPLIVNTPPLLMPSEATLPLWYEGDNIVPFDDPPDVTFPDGYCTLPVIGFGVKLTSGMLNSSGLLTSLELALGAYNIFPFVSDTGWFTP